MHFLFGLDVCQYRKRPTPYYILYRGGNIATDAQKTAVFNLNGQKMNKAKKGLFIINGKKTVIK
jgi:hypothetical protein